MTDESASTTGPAEAGGGTSTTGPAAPAATTPEVARADALAKDLVPVRPTIRRALILVGAGDPGLAVELVEGDESIPAQVRESLVGALRAGGAPAEVAERLGDALRAEDRIMSPDVIECYRAAFYFGRDWEAYARNPLFARFTANKAWQGFDKWVHYFDIYARTLAPYVGKPVRVLEIGVFHGGGLDQLRALLGEDAVLIGADINEEAQAVCAGRFEVAVGDQRDPEFLARLVAEHGPFDVIIDDGGHTMAQQLDSIEHLFDTLNDGGVYIVEDTHTSYWEWYQDAPQSFMDWVKGRVDDINAYHFSHEPDLGRWTTSVTGIHVYDSIVVFDKGRHLPPFCEVAGTGSFLDTDRITESVVLGYRGALAQVEAVGAQLRQEMDESQRARGEVYDAFLNASRAVEELRTDLAETRAALAAAQGEIQTMSGSTSWKVTEPLRRLRKHPEDQQ